MPWRDGNGRLLPARDAARELLGVLQPVVARSALVAVVARELVRRPSWRGRLRAERTERALGSGPGPTALEFTRQVLRDRVPARAADASPRAGGPPDEPEDVVVALLAVSCGVLATADWIEPPTPKRAAGRRLLAGPSGRVRLGMVRGPWPGDQHHGR